jgi:hypothetical protein
MMTGVRQSVLVHSLSVEEGAQQQSFREYPHLQFRFLRIFSTTLF